MKNTIGLSECYVFPLILVSNSFLYSSGKEGRRGEKKCPRLHWTSFLQSETSLNPCCASPCFASRLVFLVPTPVTALSVTARQNDGVQMHNELDRNWKESFVVWFKVMSWYLGEVNTTKKNFNTKKSTSLPRFEPDISRLQARSVTALAKFLGPYVVVGMNVQYSSECKCLRLETLKLMYTLVSITI